MDGGACKGKCHICKRRFKFGRRSKHHCKRCFSEFCAEDGETTHSWYTSCPVGGGCMCKSCKDEVEEERRRREEEVPKLMPAPTTFVPKSSRPANLRSNSSPARSMGATNMTDMRMEARPRLAVDTPYTPLRPGDTVASANVTSSLRGLPPRVPTEVGQANGRGFMRRRRTETGASMGGGPAVPQSEYKSGLGETPNEVFDGRGISTSFDTQSTAAGVGGGGGGAGKKAPMSMRKRLFRSKSEV